jgi:hypothetical protein
MQSLIIAELLAAREPIRFHELWSRCKGRLSKASFVNALAAMTQQGIVIRKAQGRKHVEFQLDPHNPELKRQLSQIERDLAEEQDLRRKYEKLMVELGDLISQTARGSRRMKILIRALAYSHAWLLASAEIRIIFREAEIAATRGEDPFVQRVYPQIAERLRLIQRKGIIDLFKADGQTARQAFDDWLAELEGRTHEVLGTTREFLRKAS